MDAAIAQMQHDAILRVSTRSTGFLSCLFLVLKQDGTARPIFNLKRLNNFLSVKRFRLVSHFRVPSFLQRGDYLVKIDLSQAYCHVPVRSSHHRFLSLAYRGVVYEIVCLPFGLASAPQIFASLTNWIAEHLRKLGFRIIVYLDDFLLVHQDPDVLATQTGRTLACLEFLGWKVNYTKSILSPMYGVQFFRDFLEPDRRLVAPALVQDRDNHISSKRSHRVAALELD